MDDRELAKWREDYIRLENDYRREVPEIKKKQETMLGDISALQTAERDEEARMMKIATNAAEQILNRKGQKLKDWTPIIVQLLITAALLGVAYIGYQGIIAQATAAIGGGN